MINVILDLYSRYEIAVWYILERHAIGRTRQGIEAIQDPSRRYITIRCRLQGRCGSTRRRVRGLEMCQRSRRNQTRRVYLLSLKDKKKRIDARVCIDRESSKANYVVSPTANPMAASASAAAAAATRSAQTGLAQAAANEANHRMSGHFAA